MASSLGGQPPGVQPPGVRSPDEPGVEPGAEPGGSLRQIALRSGAYLAGREAVGEGLTVLVRPWLRPVGVFLPLRILLLSIPLNVLWAPAQAFIERSFAYRRMGLLELGGDVVLYVVAVPAAIGGAGA